MKRNTNKVPLIITKNICAAGRLPEICVAPQNHDIVVCTTLPPRIAVDMTMPSSWIALVIMVPVRNIRTIITANLVMVMSPMFVCLGRFENLFSLFDLISL